MAKTSVETIFGDPSRLAEPDEKFISIVTKIDLPFPENQEDKKQQLKEQDIGKYLRRVESYAEEWHRVLQADGLLWLNVSDVVATVDPHKSNYRTTSLGRQSCSFKPPTQWANLPHRVLDVFTSCGWLHRSTVVWEKCRNSKPSPKPGPSLNHQHEYIFMLAKEKFHRFYEDRLCESGSIWKIPESTGKTSATSLPIEIPRRCIALTAQRYEWVLDPCSTADGTTGAAAKQLGCNAVNYVLDRQGLKHSA